MVRVVEKSQLTAEKRLRHHQIDETLQAQILESRVHFLFH